MRYPRGRRILDSLSDEIAVVGSRFIQSGIRVVMHPDQFVVLNSDSSATVQNSISFLQAQADILDALKQPRTAWAIIEIHGGKSGRADELARAILALPIAVRSRIALENDEYAYGAKEILDICRRSGAPMVFDAHHHVIHEALKSYEDESVGQMVDEARTTWPDPTWQLVHISNGRTRFEDRGHSDFIDVMPSSYSKVSWIEVEAKMKEQAIFKLRAG
ncbi:MAG: UV damage endonuclease UvsE [Bdellovibrionia bacterium]